MTEGNLSNWGEGFSVISCHASLNSVLLATKKNLALLEVTREESEQRHLASHIIFQSFSLYAHS